MKVSLSSVIIPTAGAVASAFLVSVGVWENLRAAILPAVSIVAAAVLVRLARGLPFTNADHFNLDQFRGVAANLEGNARKLRALIFVCLGGIVCLIVAKDATDQVASFSERWPIVGEIFGRLVSALLGGLLTYSFTRVVEVVHSDVALLRLQSRIIETAIANKNARVFEKALESDHPRGIAGTQSFGTKLPH